jgi:hypothetical protein
LGLIDGDAAQIATPVRQSQQSEKQKRRTNLVRRSVILNAIGWSDYRGA